MGSRHLRHGRGGWVPRLKKLRKRPIGTSPRTYVHNSAPTSHNRIKISNRLTSRFLAMVSALSAVVANLMRGFILQLRLDECSWCDFVRVSSSFARNMAEECGSAFFQANTQNSWSGHSSTQRQCRRKRGNRRTSESIERKSRKRGNGVRMVFRRSRVSVRKSWRAMTGV
jgi:hypothetical protein